jgi:hypothetical protein
MLSEVRILTRRQVICHELSMTCAAPYRLARAVPVRTPLVDCGAGWTRTSDQRIMS